MSFDLSVKIEGDSGSRVFIIVMCVGNCHKLEGADIADSQKIHGHSLNSEGVERATFGPSVRFRLTLI